MDIHNECNSCGRQSGRDVVQRIIADLRKRADQLQLISDSLPKELTKEQDEALWHISSYSVK